MFTGIIVGVVLIMFANWGISKSPNNLFFAGIYGIALVSIFVSVASWFID